MRLKFALLLIAAFALAAPAQTVKITPKKVTYKRPKPQYDYKKTFTITYPKVRASSPALSTKIERAISYETVLKLNLNDELRRYQWLEDASYDVIYNKNGILCVSLFMEGSAAYPDSTSKIVVVDTTTGLRARAADVFTNIPALTAMVKKAQKEEAAKALVELKKDPENEGIEEAFKTSEEYNPLRIDEYSVSDEGVTFLYNYGFAHVIQALEPDGGYFYTWAQLRPYIKKGGLLTRIAR
ncbi:MAG TPA: hypothetical protein VL501_04010 [Pyrinomonadaceae bacterium]|nr:hypothetical protein [Pyrinomonadaceae bacterium]